MLFRSVPDCSDQRTSGTIFDQRTTRLMREPCMADDLDLALGILLRHAATSGGQLPLLDACDLPEDPGQEGTVTLPAWRFEIITSFRELYEPAEAEYRLQKVLNELIGKQLGRGAPAPYH